LHDVRQIEACIQPQPARLRGADGDLSQPILGKGAAPLGPAYPAPSGSTPRPAQCRRAPYRRRRDSIRSADPWDRPHWSGAGSSLQGVSLLAEDHAQVLEGHRVPGISDQGHAGVRLAQRNFQEAAQKLSAPVKQVEVHIAEAQVAEKVGIIGVLTEVFSG